MHGDTPLPRCGMCHSAVVAMWGSPASPEHPFGWLWRPRALREPCTLPAAAAVCPMRVTAWRGISASRASLACPLPLGCGAWPPWSGHPLPQLHPPPSRSSSQPVPVPLAAPPSPPAVWRRSGAGPVPVPVPIPFGGRQRRLLHRRSGPGAGPGSAGLCQRCPIPSPRVTQHKKNVELLQWVRRRPRRCSEG